MMYTYTVRLGISIGGKNTVTIQSQEEWAVGQMVKVSPGPGGFASGGVRMGPNVSMSGTIIEKH